MLSRNQPKERYEDEEDMDRSSQARGSSDEEADLKIASSMLTQAVLSDQGSESLLAALNTPEPAKAVAMILAQIMEMALTESLQTETPMSPGVWLMEDGAIDEAGDDIEAVALTAGIELPEDFIEEVIDSVAILIQERGAQGAAMEGQAGAPPSQNMGLARAQPNGGMANGRMG